jgi:hypothetical protein
MRNDESGGALAFAQADVPGDPTSCAVAVPTNRAVETESDRLPDLFRSGLTRDAFSDPVAKIGINDGVGKILDELQVNSVLVVPPAKAPASRGDGKFLHFVPDVLFGFRNRRAIRKSKHRQASVGVGRRNDAQFDVGSVDELLVLETAFLVCGWVEQPAYQASAFTAPGGGQVVPAERQSTPQRVEDVDGVRRRAIAAQIVGGSRSWSAWSIAHEDRARSKSCPLVNCLATQRFHVLKKDQVEPQLGGTAASE